ncbi:uncharacterized protein DC041_0010205 [Schistosoma bovis]|uniref:Uncharacterized protein n=1 Tax=Schistosoma bovis TaxID=6184 RepID=A0A430QAI6_SCHBO|nr:uncharacterized protein DC041_0010205 [Schistosoma bovis]
MFSGGVLFTEMHDTFIAVIPAANFPGVLLTQLDNIKSDNTFLRLRCCIGRHQQRSIIHSFCGFISGDNFSPLLIRILINFSFRKPNITVSCEQLKQNPIAPHSRYHDLVSKPKNCLPLVWIGYLSPAIIIGTWFGYTGEVSNSGLCIGPKTLRWSFVGPITTVVTFNFVILFVVGLVLLRNYLVTRKSKLNKTTYENRHLLRSFIYKHIARSSEYSSGTMALRNLCRGELESKFKKSPLHHMERDHFSSNYLSTHALRNPDNGKSAYQHDNTIRRKTQEYSSSIASPETGNSVVLCDSRQLNGELFNDISSTEEDHTVENIKNEGDVNLGFPNNRSHVLPSFNSLVTRM